jgi:hypothetical protein
MGTPVTGRTGILRGLGHELIAWCFLEIDFFAFKCR